MADSSAGMRRMDHCVASLASALSSRTSAMSSIILLVSTPACLPSASAAFPSPSSLFPPWRTHRNCRSVLRQRVQPSFSYESLIDLISSVDIWMGSLNWIFWPGAARGGHVTITRCPFAISANGWPGRTPCGTTTSYMVSPNGDDDCCCCCRCGCDGTMMRTCMPGPTPGGHVTIICWLLTSTGNWSPGPTPTGTVAMYASVPRRFGALTTIRSPVLTPAGQRTIS
mmetsp:Transcript_35614/g.61537  ORF Transcript_35614/g.61537 Transcript_35614/m.61537 type:complete len:226 (-) Transcript_35614:333-1010(-)